MVSSCLVKYIGNKARNLFRQSPFDSYFGVPPRVQVQRLMTVAGIEKLRPNLASVELIVPYMKT